MCAMKNLILCLALIGFISVSHSQIVLKETRVEYKPVSMEVDPATNSVSLVIPESYYGEFQEDPLTFIQDKFNVNQLIQENKKMKFDSYQVYFDSKKGSVLANFDKDGSLVSTYQRFKDVSLPDDVKMQILQNYKNSKVVSNRHIMATKNFLIEKEFYRVKIQDGNKTRKLKIDRNTQGLSLVNL